MIGRLGVDDDDRVTARGAHCAERRVQLGVLDMLQYVDTDQQIDLVFRKRVVGWNCRIITMQLHVIAKRQAVQKDRLPAAIIEDRSGMQHSNLRTQKTQILD